MVRTFQCPDCEYQATEKGSLKKHQQSIHMGLKLECPECEYQALWKSQLVTHHKSVHMGQKLP